MGVQAMSDCKPDKVAGREKEPEISASVTDELREEEGEIGPAEPDEAKKRRSLKPLIAIMTETTSKRHS
jgi:hypothetical protein